MGNDRSKENPDGSPVDPEGDAEYLHFIPGVGFFFKLANFIVTAISSVIREHAHGLTGDYFSYGLNYDFAVTAGLDKSTITTGKTGGAETRPINITIRIWERVS